MSQPSSPQVAIPLKQPRLKRVDQRPISKDELPRRRFGIEIKSVYFHKTSTSTRCAVNLKTSFELGSQDKFHAAHVPLNASPIGRAIPDEVEIMAHYPPEEEFVKVGREVGWRELSVAPDIDVNSPVGGIKLTGLGVRKQTEIDKCHMISLRPTIQSLENQPTYLNWKYEAIRRNFFYPKAVELLVIVDKPATLGVDPEDWFPFELRLNKELKVSTHGTLDQIRTFVADIGSQHDGWCFHIKGGWRGAIAEKFLHDLEIAGGDFDRVQSSIGLRAAVQSWHNAQGGSTSISMPVQNISSLNQDDPGPIITEA